MTTTTTKSIGNGAPADDAAARDALAQRLLSANIAAYEVACVYLGERLGLYRALAEGARTSAELADALALDERYVREWLDQQAVAGILGAEGEPRRYRLPAGHKEVLVERDSIAHLAPLSRFTVGVYSGLPLLLRAFRTGEGVPYVAYGDDAREGQAEVNRTMFVNLLGQEWLPRLPEVHARLQRGGRVADVGCGTGWSSIALARAYPEARVDGYDLDAPSVELARAAAKAEGLEARVRFRAMDAAALVPVERYDLVTVFEAVHDMARPVEALRAMRALVRHEHRAARGEERAQERFTAPGPESEWLFFGWSVLFCLPTSREQEGSAATGTAMRPATMEAYAREAGFSRVEVAPIEHDLWRFYLLRP